MGPRIGTLVRVLYLNGHIVLANRVLEGFVRVLSTACTCILIIGK